MNRLDIEAAPVPQRIGIAVATFNGSITEPMLAAALAVADRAGVTESLVLRVSGALELPLAAQSLAEAACEAIVAIGAVIKGETDHYEYVAEHATRGISDVATRTGVPVGNALLTVREYDHAVERSLPGPGNKAAEAAEAAIDLAQKLKALKDLGGGAEVHSSQ